MRHGEEKASFTLAGTARKSGDTLCPDNGGISGVGYWVLLRSPCNSEVHSAPLYGQALTVSCSLYRLDAAYSSSSTSLFMYWHNYTTRKKKVNRLRKIS